MNWNKVVEEDQKMILDELAKWGCNAQEILDAAFIDVPENEFFILRYVDDEGVKSITITRNM